MDIDETVRRMKDGESAIDIAVDKWKDIANGIGHCRGPANCALCRLYIYDKCDSCPIRKFTGCRYCESTPYIDYYEHHEIHFGFGKPDTRTCDICKNIANREVEFLEKVKSYINGVNNVNDGRK